MTPSWFGRRDRVAPGSVTASSASCLGPGAVNITGTVTGNVTVDVDLAPVREPSWRVGATYLQQVRQIAPPELIERDAELRELAEFCLEPTPASPYRWWRAGAWAGKSALLSTFVLHPPPLVQVVVFFITARFAGHDTRKAFTEVVLAQLADLTGQDLPPALTESLQEAYLLELLEQAAHACQNAGGRLALVVDGLDEDRGVTLGPDAHSIAGLLPIQPQAGMRVIIAGRRNPPVPEDVPDKHPLHDSRIYRRLEPSTFAQGIKRHAEKELRRLLTGSPVEQDLLGLLTTAHGGLSGPDLEELTGAPLWDIEEVLHTVVGRTFTRRTSHWAPEDGPETYLLGHEELQATAIRYLGEHRLVGYRDRLHAWADTYAQKGWPAVTPEYLLRGYFRLLTDTGDLSRLVACAADAARHDRMLDLSGGDAAALTEVRTVLDLIARQYDSNLTTALRLAYHRDQLTDRNANIPPDLPAVWATLGHYTRAEALATSITDPEQQAQALIGVAVALARAGHYEQAAQITRTITGLCWQEQAPTDVAVALARAGHHEQAEDLARTITNSYWQKERWPGWPSPWPRLAITSKPNRQHAASPTRTRKHGP